MTDMATYNYFQPGQTQLAELPFALIEQLPTRRQNVKSAPDFSNYQAEWRRVLGEVHDSLEDVVLRSDEVTREAVSFASAPVAIAITDDQAERLVQFHRGDVL